MGRLVYNEAFKICWSALGRKLSARSYFGLARAVPCFRVDRRVVNFEQILFANGRMLDLTEAPAQRGWAL